MQIAVFGIHNSSVSTALNLLILSLVVIWMALVYWTYADARRRLEDPMLIGCATAASLIPYVGTIIYTIVRPPEYLEDVRERNLEIQAAQARVTTSSVAVCGHCDNEVKDDFLRCPNCLRKLRDQCHACLRPLDPGWKVCPYCEAEIAPRNAARRPARRRREGGLPEVAGFDPAAYEQTP